MNKNIIIAGAIAIGLYLFSQVKKIPSIAGAQKVAPKRIGQPTTQIARIIAARKAAARKAAIRKAAAQKIGKIIGKRVAQKIPQNFKTRRALMALYAKRQRPQIQRPRPNKKKTATRLFSGAEKSRIIPYSESSRHSYYGPKSHKVFNEGYRVESNKRQARSVEANHDRVVREVLSNPKLWNRWPEGRKP